MSEDELDSDIAGLLAREAARVDDVPDDVQARLVARLRGTLPGGTPPPAGGGPLALAKLAPILAAFVAGAATGAAVLYAMTPPPKERVVYVERAAPSSEVRAEAPSAVPVEALPSVPRPRTTTPAAPTASADTFVAERRILDAARTALARGEATNALRSLAEHEKAFPTGALSEEREALFVRCLAEAGRTEEARARADRFRARWPRSLLLPAVEAAAQHAP
ncbi:MAG TPA: hypothetical protein VM925_07550 [Labilithrix sp.]|nr:hypothetical protein [Labilithrix sp.]